MLGDDSLRLANILMLHSRVFTNQRTRTDENDNFGAAMQDVHLGSVSALASSVDPNLKFPESSLWGCGKSRSRRAVLMTSGSSVSS
jgi:hypothetical protein